MSGIAAACYLAGLLFAAPIFGARTPYRLPDRLRDALVLGIALPAIAGFAGELHAVVLWVLLALACGGVVALRRTALLEATPALPVLTLCAIALVAWSGVIRPPLDGDTLAYHLPNAAGWANAHGLWTNLTRYWWYPPASELVASGLYTVAGPLATQWSGVLAIALLGTRMTQWWRAHMPEDPVLADLAGAFIVTLLPLVWQAATLQNDVFLAAFLFDAVVTLENDPQGSIRSACAAALTKPYGWLLTPIALVQRPRVLLVPACALLVWALRDVVLAPSAPTGVAGTFAGSIWTTTVAAHIPDSLVALAQAFIYHAPVAGALWCFAIAAPFVVPKAQRTIAICAAAFALVFLVLPFAYDNGVPQLASGMSLRYAAPAFVFALAALATQASRLTMWLRIIFAASALYGIGTVIATFWNDLPTVSALLVAAIVLAFTLVANRAKSAVALCAALFILCAIAVPYASRGTAVYVRDATPYGVLHSDAFASVAHLQPKRVVADGVRGGAVLLVDPSATLVDATDADACALARRFDATLVAFASTDQSAQTNRARLRAAKACGAVRYEDAMSVVTASR